MKILPIRTKIHSTRKHVIDNHIREFDSIFKKDEVGKINKVRNYIGLPLHAACVLQALYNIFNGGEPVFNLFWAKINYDFVQYIRNINKRKVALLSEYIKSKEGNNLNEIRYAVKKYFVELGMPFYPITHPKGMKKIVEQGTYPKSFETGIFFIRSDKKALSEKIISFILKK